MVPIREGRSSVLLVVDAQVGVMKEVWESSRILKNIGTAVDKARDQGIPIVWIRHSDDELAYGSAEWQWVPELSPKEGEVVIDKRFNSAFEETVLVETLSELDVTQIVLSGAATNWCVRATAYAALERGYDLVVVSDAHTTESIELDDGERIEAPDIIREFNIVMMWVQYPDRSTGAVSAEDLDFVGINNSR